MHKLRRRLTETVAAAGLGLLLLSGCSSVPAASPDAQEETPQATAAPLAEPSIEITHELDGKSTTARAALGTSSCSSHMFSAMSGDGHGASAIFSVTEAGESGQIQASIVGDSLLVFQGKGAPVFRTGADQTKRASVVGLSGTATVVEIPAGTAPAIGEVDLSTGTTLRATLTATLACTPD